MPDVTADYLALRREAGAVLLDRDVVRATGPDTDAYLQGQLSQDVAGIAPGSSAWSLLLEPQGKLVAWLRLSRLGENDLLLDLDAGWADAAVSRLERFKLRTRCDLEPQPGWSAVAVRGPAAPGVDTSGAAVVADPQWPGVAGVDLLGPDVAVPAGVRACGPEAFESVRIEAGVPRYGAELREGMIPAEAGVVEGSVSWSKGCYTGQELVARIDSRGGHTPRRLLGVVVGANALPPPGAAVVGPDGREVGSLTSVGESLDRRAPVALAFVHRSLEAPAAVSLRWEGGEAPARVEPLPLV